MVSARAIAVCCSVVLGFSALIPSARAETAAAVINGVYSGSYVCGPVTTRFQVSLTASPAGGLAGAVTVYPANSSEGYTYDLTGPYIPSQGAFQLRPQKWETAAPPNLKMMPMSGRFFANAGEIDGTMLLVGCGNFRATRPQPVSAGAVTPPTAVSNPAAAPAPQSPQNTPPAQSAPVAARKRPALPPELNTGDVPMEIQLFDRMADVDQIRYVTELQDAVKAAAKPDQLPQVTRFFRKKQPDEYESGMGKFEMRLAQERVQDIQNVLTNPKATRLLVDDQMIWALERNGIFLAPAPVVRNFHRNFEHLRNPLSLENALKTQELVTKDVHRNVGPPTGAELEHPTDATWIDRLAFAEPDIVRALYTGDFKLVTSYRSQALSYIQAMDIDLQPHCPNLFDDRISAQASTEIGVRTILQMPTDASAGGLHADPNAFREVGTGRLPASKPSGNQLDLQNTFRRAFENDADGKHDAEILYARVLSKCGSSIFQAIQKNMARFVGVH